MLVVDAGPLSGAPCFFMPGCRGKGILKKVMDASRLGFKRLNRRGVIIVS
jgi:hypothetical protein